MVNHLQLSIALKQPCHHVTALCGKQIKNYSKRSYMLSPSAQNFRTKSSPYTFWWPLRFGCTRNQIKLILPVECVNFYSKWIVKVKLWTPRQYVQESADSNASIAWYHINESHSNLILGDWNSSKLRVYTVCTSQTNNYSPSYTSWLMLCRVIITPYCQN